MSAVFTKAIDQVLIEEGGYSNDSGDIGGETNFGISKQEYPNLDIRNLTRVQAIQIYERDYWNKNNMSDFSSQTIANAVFDMVVNMGPADAGVVLQKALFALGTGARIDGVIGPNTFSLANNIQSPGRLLDNIQLNRIDFYCNRVNKDKSQSRFLLGWIQRTRRAI